MHTYIHVINNIKYLLIHIFSEIVAFVDEIENTKIFGEPTKEKKRWRIFFKTNEGKRIQVTMWNKEIDRLQDKIKLGHVMFSTIIYFNLDF